MRLELKKTLLTKRPSPQSVLMGLVSYLLLVILFFFDDQNLTANGYLVFEKGQYWKAFTTTLMHGGFTHLGSNTIFFTAFAIMLNYYFGFWIFPVLSFIMGGIINLTALKFYDPQVYLVGISGVIYFMAAFWMSMFVMLERKKSVIKRLIVATGVSLVLFFPQVFEKNTSYLAHGLGFGFGIILATVYFWINRKILRSHEVWEEKIVTVNEDLEYQALHGEMRPIEE